MDVNLAPRGKKTRTNMQKKGTRLSRKSVRNGEFTSCKKQGCSRAGNETRRKERKHVKFRATTQEINKNGSFLSKCMIRKEKKHPDGEVDRIDVNLKAL